MPARTSTPPRSERAVADALSAGALPRRGGQLEVRLAPPARRSRGRHRALIDTRRSLKLQREPVNLRDPAMTALTDALRRIAAAPINVLVLGETGAGKDVVASMVHERSVRAGKPLVSVNCASLPESLLESELFGHERGAFTGARRRASGASRRPTAARCSSTRSASCPSLCRRSCCGRSRPHGDARRRRRERPVDVRIIAATNRDLPARGRRRRFGRTCTTASTR